MDISDNKAIKLFQNLLKQKRYFDIADKLEDTNLEYSFDGIWKKITFKVNPKYIFDLSNCDKNIRREIIKILNLISFDNINEVENIDFKINEKSFLESFEDVLYFFVDESGDMDFSEKGSKYYMFSFLVKKRPFKLHETISSYRYSLLERNLNPLNNRLDIEKFHACEDNKHIREHLFNLISKFEDNDIQIYSYILEKPKVMPEKIKEKSNFYAENLSYAIIKLLEKLKISKNFIVITDNLPVQKNKQTQIKAIKNGVNTYITNNKLNIRYDIFHHCSASSVNLQLIDYINWAIQRKYEKNDTYFYEKIKKYILDEEIVTKERITKYY